MVLNIKKLAYGVAAITGLLVMSAALAPVTSAYEGGDRTAKLAQQEKKVEVKKVDDDKKDEKQSSATYKYVTQMGDSYSQMARKAVQTYGIVNKVKLTPAQIVYAETNLTNEANMGYLEVGQEVEIKVSSIKQWVESAKTLSGEQQAAWEAYVSWVDFNTNHVGEV